MKSFDTYGRLVLPVLAGACGGILYILSPLSHQAFCFPRSAIPVLVAPDASAIPGAD